VAKAIELASKDAKKMVSRLILIHGNARVLKDTNLITYKDESTGKYALIHTKNEMQEISDELTHEISQKLSNKLSLLYGYSDVLECNNIVFRRSLIEKSEYIHIKEGLLNSAIYSNVQKIQGTTLVKVGIETTEYQAWGGNQTAWGVLDADGNLLNDANILEYDFTKIKMLPNTNLISLQSQKEPGFYATDVNFKTVIENKNYIMFNADMIKILGFWSALRNPSGDPVRKVSSDVWYSSTAYAHYFNANGKYLGTAKTFFEKVAKLGATTLIALTKLNYTHLPTTWLILDTDFSPLRLLELDDPENADGYNEIDTKDYRECKEYNE